MEHTAAYTYIGSFEYELFCCIGFPCYFVPATRSINPANFLPSSSYDVFHKYHIRLDVPGRILQTAHDFQ
jgi:hypothetical protein